MPPLSSLVVEILLSSALIVAGGIFYFPSRRAAWLAGSRVATLIVLAGLTLIWSSGVPGHGSLTVMWIAAMAMAMIHLERAVRAHRFRPVASPGPLGGLDPVLLSSSSFAATEQDLTRADDRRVYI